MQLQLQLVTNLNWVKVVRFYDTMILLATKEMDIFNKNNMYETHIKRAIGIEDPISQLLCIEQESW